ncbi:MAG: hypothetical protein ACK40M_02625 [Flavobacteriales bacterium]
MYKYLIAATLLIVACIKSPSGSADKNAITETDATRANELFPGTTLADLQKGKLIYDANCGKCHKLHQPDSRSVDSWTKIVPPMSRKAKVGPEDEKLILRYVVTMAKKT